MRGRTLVGVVNLFLQLKASDENNSKIESINLSSFKVQFFSHCYDTQAGIGKDDSQLSCACDPISGWQKNQYFSIYGLLKSVVLLINPILSVSVHDKI